MAVIPFRWVRELDQDNRATRPLGSLQKEVNRLMDGFFNDWEVVPLTTSTSAAITPHLDIVEGEKDFTIHAELPGLDENDLDLSFAKGVLTLKGEKRLAEEHKGKNFIRSERSFGSFLRAIPFSTEIDEAKIQASFKKGILTIQLPKAAAALKEAKKISIKSE